MMTFEELDLNDSWTCGYTHTEPMIDCESCEYRKDERCCLDCDAQLFDGEWLFGESENCAHDRVVDGFEHRIS